jgi:hypothetical protein
MSSTYERTVQENLSSNPKLNNYWLGFTFLPAELQVTRGLSPKNLRVNLTLKKTHKNGQKNLLFFSSSRITVKCKNNSNESN